MDTFNLLASCVPEDPLSWAVLIMLGLLFNSGAIFQWLLENLITIASGVLGITCLAYVFISLAKLPPNLEAEPLE